MSLQVTVNDAGSSWAGEDKVRDMSDGHLPTPAEMTGSLHEYLQPVEPRYPSCREQPRDISVGIEVDPRVADDVIVLGPMGAENVGPSASIPRVVCPPMP